MRNIDIARALPNQDISALKGNSLLYVADHYLPLLLKTWKEVEVFTGYRWKPTSYIRQSPNHQFGTALDIAPLFTPDAERLYSVHRKEDPFLYKRGVLLRKLQALIREARLDMVARNNVVVVVECDHLHMQFMRNSLPSLVKWKQPKPIYSDSFINQNLPMFN